MDHLLQRIVPQMAFAILLLTIGCQQNGPQPDKKTATATASETKTWDKLELEVVGHEFQWQLRYPGSDKQLGTADDLLAIRNLHLPENAQVTLLLKSKDYLYTYSIPHFHKQEIAVPDMTFRLELPTGKPAQYPFRGDQFCGYSHPQLSGQLVVESAEEFNEWLNSLPNFSDDE